MSRFKDITPQFAVSPQISREDVAFAAIDGFTSIICNRPDGEDQGQLSAETIGAACTANGLTFTHIPILGAMSQSQVSLMANAIDAAQGPVLAYCRSGTRSANAWALAMATNGDNVDDLVAATADAGYDLSGLVPTLRAAGAR